MTIEVNVPNKDHLWVLGCSTRWLIVLIVISWLIRCSSSIVVISIVVIHVWSMIRESTSTTLERLMFWVLWSALWSTVGKWSWTLHWLSIKSCLTSTSCIVVVHNSSSTIASARHLLSVCLTTSCCSSTSTSYRCTVVACELFLLLVVVGLQISLDVIALILFVEKLSVASLRSSITDSILEFVILLHQCLLTTS